MLRKYALSSMALLGLTRAQLWVRRSKTFTVHSVTPMDRLLTLVDSGDDNIVVELTCKVSDPSYYDLPADYPLTEAGPYTTYYNNINREDIGQRFCPVSNYGEANRRSYDTDMPG